MAKGHGKSSATSATRKKHQKKTAASLGIDFGDSTKSQEGKFKSKEKSGRGKKDPKKEPRIKAYIPPVKPARAQPDPLEVDGLARRLPPELVVVLKNVGKKAQVTKVRALEELGGSWVEKVLKVGDKSGREMSEEEGPDTTLELGIDITSSLVEMVPAWVHHIPSLFIHPSRRVRLLAISVHAGLLKIPEVREQILFHLKETATSEEVESVMGSWCVLMYDIEKSVASAGKDAWDSFVRYSPAFSTKEAQEAEDLIPTQFNLDATSKNVVFGFVQRTMLDPLGVYTYLNPPPVSSAPTPPISTSKNQRGGNKGTALTKQQNLAAAIAAARKGGLEEKDLTKSKTEEDDESETDRKARLRIGGIGALGYFFDHDVISDEATMFLNNPLLWTILHHAAQAPYVNSGDAKNFGDTESFGFGQPNVRKAGWSLLMKLLETHKKSISPILPVLSSAVLRSAWVESDTLVQGIMWQPLLTFIKEFPDCWVMEMTMCYGADHQDGDDDDDVTDGDDEDDEEGVKLEESRSKSHQEGDVSLVLGKPSLAYQEFLQFLQLGCSGSPVQGYPTVVIILSTIPSSIIASVGTKTPLEDLFASFWAALDGRALSSLHRAATAAAFLSSVLESVVFLSRRVLLDWRKAEQDKVEITSVLLSDGVSDAFQEAESLVLHQFGRVWEEMKKGRLKVEERAGARLVGQNLDALEKVDSAFTKAEQKEHKILREAAWNVLDKEIRDATRTHPSLVATFLKVLCGHFKDDTASRSEARQLVHVVLETTMQSIITSIRDEGRESINAEIQFLQCMFEQFREGLFDDVDFAQQFGELVRTRTGFFFELSTSLLFAYLFYRKDERDVLAAWHAILDFIVACADDAEKLLRATSDVISVVQKGQLPGFLRPRSNELDDLIGRSLENVLSGSTDTNADFEVVKVVLISHDYFISETGFVKFVETITTSINLRVELMLGGSKEHYDQAALQRALELLDLVTPQSNGHTQNTIDNVLPNVYLFGYLIPACAAYAIDPHSHAFTLAQRIWEREANTLALEGERRDVIVGSVKVKMRDLIMDTQVQLLPEEILVVLSVQGLGLNVSLLGDLFPSPKALYGMFRQLSHDPIDSSLAVMDFLIPLGIGSPTQSPEQTDNRGFSAYARIVIALLRVFSEDRSLAKQNLWALRHFIALSIYASDYQKVPAGTSPVFDAAALPSLGEIIIKAQQITAYMFLASLASVQDGWSLALVRRLLEGKTNTGLTVLGEFVEDIIRTAAESDSPLDTRVMRSVLEIILEEVEVQEADEWIALARKLEKSAPETSMAIVVTITETRAEPQRLDRYRNEHAAELLGIKPSGVATTGLLTLRRLGAAAPDLDSDTVFLPQNRAVNVIKACQGWATSDDAEVDEEIESAMTLIFIYLAPILQNVPGSHWEFIWDVLENNLEMSSIADDNTLPTLARSLRLVIIMEDLVKSNKLLKTEWDKRRKNVLEMISDQAIVKLGGELVLSIMRELPDSLVDENTLSKMCHLVVDHSWEVQKMGYSILRTAARKRTEHLVIEAGVDTDSSMKATLPSELLDIVQRHIDVRYLDDDEEQQNVFGSLLGWMLVFDLFQDASFKVKSGYIEQLRNLELINSNFIPLFLVLLRLSDGLEKAFKLGVWAVDEFYVDLLEPGNSVSIPLLMAHLYYRALLSTPALIHSWLSNCKDRQLSTAVTSFTSQHFSPVIIEVELAHIKGPAGQELSDDTMSIKVAAAVNEVMASYLVDEHQLEIKLKIPADWPLHKMEVKDIKRVGVDNDRWRAWILAVQQIIWSHNGRITDGLSLFKRNATLHFEGQVECAICYSIISVMDGSLPKKPCKTCKNKFHAGCLYKWFHTSNASTCPLCRSEISLG